MTCKHCAHPIEHCPCGDRCNGWRHACCHMHSCDSSGYGTFAAPIDGQASRPHVCAQGDESYG